MSAKQFADRAFHKFSKKTRYKNGFPFSLAPASAYDQTPAFVFVDFFKIRSPLQSLTHKNFLLLQNLFHFPLQKKDNQKFRRNQEYNHHKKNCVFHIFSPFRYNSISTTTFRLSIRRSHDLKDIFSGFAARIIFAAVA